MIYLIISKIRREKIINKDTVDQTNTTKDVDSIRFFKTSRENYFFATKISIIKAPRALPTLSQEMVPIVPEVRKES